MSILTSHAGRWVGTNGFRLRPDEDFFEAPATAEVTTGAGGHLARVAYTWSLPDEGPFDGMLVLGRGPEDGEAVAIFADAWHQQPASLVMRGTVADAVWSVEAAYLGDWRWRIVVDATDDDLLRIRMENVVPPGGYEGAPEGPYSAMVSELRRADVSP